MGGECFTILNVAVRDASMQLHHLWVKFPNFIPREYAIQASPDSTSGKYLYLGFISHTEGSQPSVKGVTHCLLPGCSNPTWPFENYCGRSHANIGKQQGLERMFILYFLPNSHQWCDSVE